MPTYDFQCEPCSNHIEAYVPLTTTTVPCPGCGVGMEKVWTVSIRKEGAGFPFTTKNLTGEPIVVESQSHLDRLCKEHNVTHRPDAGWIEKEYLGYNMKTKKQMYKEGSGAGLPGCWF